MEKFKLHVNDGKVRYMVKDGEGFVGSDTPVDRAMWLVENKPVTKDTSLPWPEFCVCAGGEYWLDGEWEAPGIFDDEKKKGRKEKGVLGE